eukprot:6178662-Pleurochrysis_carterae.AAC.3
MQFSAGRPRLSRYQGVVAPCKRTRKEALLANKGSRVKFRASQLRDCEQVVQPTRHTYNNVCLAMWKSWLCLTASGILFLSVASCRSMRQSLAVCPVASAPSVPGLVTTNVWTEKMTRNHHVPLHALWANLRQHDRQSISTHPWPSTSESFHTRCLPEPYASCDCALILPHTPGNPLRQISMSTPKALPGHVKAYRQNEPGE